MLRCLLDGEYIMPAASVRGVGWGGGGRPPMLSVLWVWDVSDWVVPAVDGREGCGVTCVRARARVCVCMREREGEREREREREK